MPVLPSSSVVVFGAIIFVLFQQTCFAKHRPSCPPSSCGKIRNITYPFRLKSDPHGCGLPMYELDCVNNVTVSTLFSGKYYVQDINYESYEIRLTDAGVVEDTTCSIPRYFLSTWNFSDDDQLTLMDVQEYAYPPLKVVILNCSNPVTDDPRYVEVNAGRCDSGGHIYAVLDDSYPEFTVMDMKVGCRLKVATFANLMQGRNVSYTNRTLDRNVSYADIHKLLHDGFSLSWLFPVICRDHCRIGASWSGCYKNQTTEQIECYAQSHHCYIFTHDSDFCGMPSRVLGDTIRFVEGIVYGFFKRIRHVKRSSLNKYNRSDVIGQAVLPIFVVARYLLGVAFFACSVYLYVASKKFLNV